MKVLYRYEIEYSNAENGDTNVVLREYQVVKETEYTYFIKPSSYPVFSKKLKRVLKLRKFNNGYQQTGEFTKRFAYARKEDAMFNFKARTAKRISWYKYWIEQCENGLEIISNEHLLQGKN